MTALTNSMAGPAAPKTPRTGGNGPRPRPRLHHLWWPTGPWGTPLRGALWARPGNARARTKSAPLCLIEPIQCEAGILIPPDGYLRQAAELCARERVLLVADEIQTGLGRTGMMFACQHENVQPDVYV